MKSKFLTVVKGLALTLTAMAIFMSNHLNAHADEIIISSNGTAGDAGESNSTGLATILIPPHPAWAGALPGSGWVSHMNQTGNPGDANFNLIPNGSVITFNETFTLNSIAVAGSLTVMADDTASVHLNGFVLANEADLAGNTFTICSDFPIGCTVLTARTFTFAELSPLLVNGVNTLSFNVAQRAGGAYGLNYSGSILEGGRGAGTVPEPATITLLASSLLGLAGAARRRRRNARKSERL